MKLDVKNAAAAVAVFLFVPALAFAGAAEGEKKAVTCVACHGEGGNSMNPQWPSLAGQPAQFISTSLFMFREGNRTNALMTPMAKPPWLCLVKASRLARPASSW